MNKPTNPIAASVVPMAGQKLPSDWQQKAKLRAKMAEASYLHDLQNSWRGNPNAVDPNVMRAARLSTQGNPPSQEEMTMRTRLNSPHWEDLLGRQ